jgi:hypothetical protein
MATQSVETILNRELPAPSFSIVPSEANPNPGGDSFSRSGGAYSITASGRKDYFSDGEPRSYRAQQGLLIEPAREQFLSDPNNFKNWSSRNLSVTGPGSNLGFDYYALTEDSTSGAHDISKNVSGTGAGQPFTVSVIARNDSRNLCISTRISDGTTNSLFDAFFDLANKEPGEVESLADGTIITHDTEPLDGGWVRCIVSVSPNSGFEIDKVYLRLAKGATIGDDTYQGDGISRNSVRSAQVEDGPNSSTHYLSTGTRGGESVSLFSGGQPEWWSPNVGTFIVTVTPLFHKLSTVGNVIGISFQERHIYGNAGGLWKVSDGSNKATLGAITPYKKQRLVCSFDSQNIYAATNGGGEKSPHNGSLLGVSSLNLLPPGASVVVHSFQYIPAVVESLDHAKALTA